MHVQRVLCNGAVDINVMYVYVLLAYATREGAIVLLMTFNMFIDLRVQTCVV